MFKAQASHRQKMETIHMERAYKLSSRGMALGFIVNVSTMGAAVVLAMLKMDGAAIAAIVAAILTNLSFFSSFLVKSKN